ncbi:anti-sigma factor [Beutenbergia cavernae DSM 12333]|uniref:Anti-sigma factor n=1 Tax=Beutenbergia cavernae (strain ATCC BAA-8 / DSM 12333 / CCUG 43141 / JCM 11478 / NBRC 16432 / NCIMB 13614 / HKI 0122) TaxID=471853 RepID=C5C1Q8_BEUC1|nr:mycothiol system anti-sigma-R factor [Beutenbergia cavernae]ACQ79526.1 anti-sigma factor [Beutenbergia cavernae DSM 12333]
MSTPRDGAGDDEAALLAARSVSAQCQCTEALEKLETFLDSEMGELDADRLRTHLEACEPCLEAADLEQRLRNLVRRACHEQAPDGLRARVRTQLTVMSTRVVISRPD